MPKELTALRSQGCVMLMLGLVVAVAGPAVDRTLFARSFSAAIGCAVMITGGALFLRAPRRKSGDASQAMLATLTHDWPTSAEKLVTICKPTSLTEQLFVESLLRAYRIPFVTQNASAQNLIGFGQFGGVNVAIGPPEIQVSAADVSRAERLMLARATEPTSERGSDDDAS